MRASRIPEQLPSLRMGVCFLGVFAFISYGHYHYHSQQRGRGAPAEVQKNRTKFELEGPPPPPEPVEIKDKPVILLWGREVKGPATYWYTNLCSFQLTGARWTEQPPLSFFTSRSNREKQHPKLRRMCLLYITTWGIRNCYKFPLQLRVSQNQEPNSALGPVHSANLTPHNGRFNWTMNYRPDSDVPVPYGDYTKLTTPLAAADKQVTVNNVTLDEWVSRKRELIAGVISNCRTPGKREEYKTALEKQGEIRVDIYGACGGVPAFNRYDFRGNFWTDLAQEYKFFFAAENSLCSDYVTEKLWRSLDLGMVPVVLGGADYGRIAPPGSFIDAKEFSSPGELAAYLAKLDKEDPQEYNKYFEWRGSYRVQVNTRWLDWCPLCESVKEWKGKVDRDPVHAAERYSKVYHNLREWWARKAPGSTENACGRPIYSYKLHGG